MTRILALSLLAALMASTPVLRGEESYTLGPDSQRQDGVPKGTVSSHVHKSAGVPGTTREYHVYVPAQYDGKSPAAVMVFQDGHTYVKEDGELRVPVVFDNLIQKKELPVTIGIFINPGHKGDELPKDPWK